MTPKFALTHGYLLVHESRVSEKLGSRESDNCHTGKIYDRTGHDHVSPTLLVKLQALGHGHRLSSDEATSTVQIVDLHSTKSPCPSLGLSEMMTGSTSYNIRKTPRDLHAYSATRETSSSDLQNLR